MNRLAFSNSTLIGFGLAACVMLLFAVAAPPLLAAETPATSAEEVIAQHLEAIGGVEALKKVETRKVQYRVHMFGRDGYSMKRSWKRPDIMRTEMPGAPAFTLTEGGKSWRVRPDGRIEMPGPVAANFARLADIDGPFIDSKKKGISFEYLGTEQYDMTELCQLRLIFNDGAQWDLFFDAKSGLLRKRKQPSFFMLDNEIVQGPDTWTYFFDYRSVKGLLFPHIRVQTTDSHTHVFVTEEVLINE